MQSARAVDDAFPPSIKSDSAAISTSHSNLSTFLVAPKPPASATDLFNGSDQSFNYLPILGGETGSRGHLSMQFGGRYGSQESSPSGMRNGPRGSVLLPRAT